MSQVIEIFRNSAEKTREQEALSTILLTCRRAQRFHCLAEQLVDNRTMRDLFKEIAEIHHTVLNLAEAEVYTKPKNRKNIKLGKTVYESVIPNFVPLTALIQSGGFNRPTQVLPEVMEVETQSIAWLRSKIRHIRTRKLRQQLSSQIALMQISYDQMKLVNETRTR